LDDGAEAGVLDSDPTLGGVDASDWIDILNCITVQKGKLGEYPVFVEEDYPAKAIMRWWKP
jgi:hypothetical protein